MTIHQSYSDSVQMRGLIFIFYLFLIIIMYGCDIDSTSEPVVRSELIGVYRPNYNAGKAERIELFADSTYVHFFTSNAGINYSDTSQWKLIYESGKNTRPRILFNDFIDRYPIRVHAYSSSGILDTNPKGWGPYILKTEKRIIIKRSPNSNQYYLKQQQ